MRKRFITLALGVSLLGAGPALANGVRIGAAAYPTLQLALDAAKTGDRVEIDPGEYREAGIVRANWLTLAFAPGAKFIAATAEGKALLVVQGNNTTITGLDCSGIAVSGQNGACVRLEGQNITLDNVYFHDSEQGILGGGNGGRVEIVDSLFERLGAAGQAHGVYMAADKLIIRNSRILASKGQGHEVKSRARETVIDNSVIASLDGEDSRLVDISNGGILRITNSVLQKGPATSNGDLIGYGLEGDKFPENRIELTGNVFILERDGPNHPLHTAKDTPTIFVRNMIIGKSADPVPEGNLTRASRAEAGLPPAPKLPQPKGMK